MKKKYFIRLVNGSFEEQITLSGRKPVGYGWKEVEVDKCCSSITSLAGKPIAACEPDEPVLFLGFTDAGGMDYFIGEGDAMQIQNWNTVSIGDRLIHIPRGVFNVVIWSNGVVGDFFINGELAGNFPTAGSEIRLENYDTSTVKSWGYYDPGNPPISYDYTGYSSYNYCVQTPPDVYENTVGFSNTVISFKFGSADVPGDTSKDAFYQGMTLEYVSGPVGTIDNTGLTKTYTIPSGTSTTAIGSKTQQDSHKIVLRARHPQYPELDRLVEGHAMWLYCQGE